MQGELNARARLVMGRSMGCNRWCSTDSRAARQAEQMNDALARDHGHSDFEPDFREEALEAFALTPHNVAFAVGTSSSASACHALIGRAT